MVCQSGESGESGESGFFIYGENKKSRQRPTLARASPALPSAMEPLTSVFGMGTGMTTPLWPPAKNRFGGLEV